MGTAYFYSDETGQHSNGRYFLIGGAVFTRHHKLIADQLAHAERVSLKGKQDWKGTKNVKQRIRYIEEVLAIEHLKGSIFYASYPDNDKQYWACTVDALTRAIVCFGANRYSLIRHQGFNFKTREKLKAALQKAQREFQIQTGSEKRAEIRLADAICGYIGLVRFNPESKTADLYPPMPEWFIDLKHEAPV